jgi:hypothetical protein
MQTCAWRKKCRRSTARFVAQVVAAEQLSLAGLGGKALIISADVDFDLKRNTTAFEDLVEATMMLQRVRCTVVQPSWPAPAATPPWVPAP